MNITWLGHSCFLLEADGYQILLDPFEQVQGMADIHTQAHEVFCSHEHFDHAFRQGVTLLDPRPSPFTVREIESMHDDQQGRLRGKNTIRTFTSKGLTVVHLGDLGTALSPEQVAAIGPCDAVLLPIGGTYTIDPVKAKAAAEALCARVIIPMHYRSGGKGFPELCTVQDFTRLFPGEAVHCYQTSSLELEPNTPSQVAVLKMP